MYTGRMISPSTSLPRDDTQSKETIRTRVVIPTDQVTHLQVPPMQSAPVRFDSQPGLLVLPLFHHPGTSVCEECPLPARSKAVPRGADLAFLHVQQDPWEHLQKPKADGQHHECCATESFQTNLARQPFRAVSIAQSCLTCSAHTPASIETGRPVRGTCRPGRTAQLHALVCCCKQGFPLSTQAVFTPPEHSDVMPNHTSLYNTVKERVR